MNQTEGEICDSTPEAKASKLVKRHSLDPKMIQSLELDIMRAIMAKDSPVRTERAESDEHSNPSFTMESFSVTAPDGSSNPPIPQGTSPSDVKIQQRPGNTTYNGNRNTSFCASCCNPIPNRLQVANCRTGPVSAYSIMNNSLDLLPPQDKNEKGKISLVLDLDETLVHSSFMAVPNADFAFVLGVDSNRLGVYVCVRPGVAEFLKRLGDIYELILFTASSKFYADQVVDEIDPERKIKLRLYRESCTEFSGCQVKDLSKLGRDLKRIAIVDNSNTAYMLQPYNAIPITSWYDDPADNELLDLCDFLEKHADAESVYDFLVAPA